MAACYIEYYIEYTGYRFCRVMYNVLRFGVFFCNQCYCPIYIYFRIWYIQMTEKIQLNHFRSVYFFNSPWKHKTCFLMPSVAIKGEHWPDIGQLCFSAMCFLNWIVLRASVMDFKVKGPRNTEKYCRPP